MTSVPDRGQIVWLDFDPQRGREQKGRRPAIVLSPRRYNELTGLAVVCPITSQIKNYPFEVALPSSGSVRGVILCDQVKSLSWRDRRAEHAGDGTAVLDAVLVKLKALLQL